MKAIYTRYGVLGDEDFDTFEEAKQFLQSSEDNGEASAVGVFDELSGTFYHNYKNVIGVSEEKLSSDNIKIAEKFGAILKIETFDLW